MRNLPNRVLEKRLLEFLEEDTPYGDLTGGLLPTTNVSAVLLSKESGVICGIKFAQILMESLGITVIPLCQDGARIKPGDIVLEIQGDSQIIIAVERTVLNIVMRLSGIATQTHKLVERVKGSGLNIRVSGTRKTTPGFRFFEKYAIEIGGGDSHRMNLSDMVLIKENHITAIGEEDISAIFDNLSKSISFSKKIEVEVENIEQFLKVLPYKPDIIMLDDFSIHDIKKVIEILKKNGSNNNIMIEVSGGITPENIQDYFIDGIDIISLGFLTHSVRSIDFSMKINQVIARNR